MAGTSPDTSNKRPTPSSRPPGAGLLLPVKTTRPRARPGLVARPRLVARLNQGLEQRLTLISAPGGYGKTTAVVQWLDAIERPAGWLSLDVLDNDLTTFVAYLLAAARVAYPAVGRHTTPLLTSPQQISPDTFADALIEDFAGLDGPLVLVLDDFHLMRDGDVLRLMDRLLQFIARNVHLVLITRAEPDLSLTRARLRGELAELRADDLRFDSDAAARLLSNLTGAPFDEDAAATLDAITEGWVLALQLAGLSIRDGETPAALARRFGSNVHEHLAAYLMEEVFARQPTPVRDFLLRTAILERFSAPLCAAVAEVPDAADMLARLMQTNQMIIPLDDSRHWFRYHQLFQQFLLDRLPTLLPPETIADLHRRAAAWLGARGQVSEAISHAVAADDADIAVSLIEDNLQQVLNAENWQELDRRLALLPAAAQNHPAVLVARGWHHLFHLRIHALAHSIGAAAGGLLMTTPPPERRDRLQTQIDILTGVVAYWINDIKTTLALLGKSLPALLPEMSYVRGIGGLYYALATHADGRPDEALRYLQAALDGQARHEDWYTARLLIGRMTISADIGDLQTALQISDQLKQIGQRSKIWNSYGWSLYGSGYVYYDLNRLTEAEAAFGRIIETPHQFSASTSYQAFMLQAMTLDARGQTAAADEVLRRGRDFAISTNGAFILPYFAAAEDMLRLRRGLPVSLAPAVLPNLAESILDLRVPQIVSTIQTRARCLIRIGTPDSLAEARDHLRVHYQAAEQLHMSRQLAGTMALDAIATAAQGDAAAALETLRRSLRQAETSRAIRTFVDCGPALIPLLEALSAAADPPALTDAVLAACRAQWAAEPLAAAEVSSRRRPAAEAMRVALTGRELEVLRLMARQMSDKEIAARLFVTPGAVRQYGSRLYAKLGVNNRREAVAAAQQLGLIPRE